MLIMENTVFVVTQLKLDDEDLIHTSSVISGAACLFSSAFSDAEGLYCKDNSV